LTNIYLHVVIFKLCDSEPLPAQVRNRLYFVWSTYTNISRFLLILVSVRICAVWVT